MIKSVFIGFIMTPSSMLTLAD